MFDWQSEAFSGYKPVHEPFNVKIVDVHWKKKDKYLELTIILKEVFTASTISHGIAVDIHPPFLGANYTTSIELRYGNDPNPPFFPEGITATSLPSLPSTARHVFSPWEVFDSLIKPNKPTGAPVSIPEHPSFDIYSVGTSFSFSILAWPFTGALSVYGGFVGDVTGIVGRPISLTFGDEREYTQTAGTLTVNFSAAKFMANGVEYKVIGVQVEGPYVVVPRPRRQGVYGLRLLVKQSS